MVVEATVGFYTLPVLTCWGLKSLACTRLSWAQILNLVFESSSKRIMFKIHLSLTDSPEGVPYGVLGIGYSSLVVWIQLPDMNSYLICLFHHDIVTLPPGQGCVVTFVLLLPSGPQPHPVTNFRFCLFFKNGYSLWWESCVHKLWWCYCC